MCLRPFRAIQYLQIKQSQGFTLCYCFRPFVASGILHLSKKLINQLPYYCYNSQKQLGAITENPSFSSFSSISDQELLISFTVYAAGSLLSLYFPL
jgi:hypothetical protein